MEKNGNGYVRWTSLIVVLGILSTIVIAITVSFNSKVEAIGGKVYDQATSLAGVKSTVESFEKTINDVKESSKETNRKLDMLIQKIIK